MIIEILRSFRTINRDVSHLSTSRPFFSRRGQGYIFFYCCILLVFSLYHIPQLGWLWVFLAVYIRAFQQASDLNDDVEDKLLVGDRPKHSRDPRKLHRKERLTSRNEEDLQDVGGTSNRKNIFDISIFPVDSRGTHIFGVYRRSCRLA